MKFGVLGLLTERDSHSSKSNCRYVMRPLPLAFLSVAMLCFALSSQAALASPAWLPPSDLSAAGQDAWDPQVAVDAQGNAVAVWRGSNGSDYVVQAATRPAGGSFGAPADLSAAGQDAWDPQVAVDAQGNAVAVWRRYNGSKWIVQAATRPAGGSFGAPTDLSAAGRNASYPEVAVDPQGNAAAVWYRDGQGADIVQAATRPAGGSFGAPTDLAAASQNGHEPQVAVDAQGNAVAVWRGSNGSNDIIQAATSPAGGSFGAPTDLSAAGRNAHYPQVTVDPQGNTVAVWSRYNGSDYIIQAATRPAGGSFGAPADLSAAGQDAYEPEVAVDQQGNAVAVWRGSNGSDYVVQAATRPAPIPGTIEETWNVSFDGEGWLPYDTNPNFAHSDPSNPGLAAFLQTPSSGGPLDFTDVRNVNAGWMWQHPRSASAFVEEANFSWVSQAGGPTSTDAITRVGLYDETASAWLGERSWTGNVSDRQATLGRPQRDAKQARFELFVPGGRVYPDEIEASVGQVSLALGDGESPRIEGLNHQGAARWMGDGGSRSVTVTATDGEGLGVKRLLFEGDGDQRVERVHPCTGTITGPGASLCPKSWAQDIGYAVSSAPEGLHIFRVKADDVLSKPSPWRSWQVGIDRTSPTLALSGPLWSRRELTVTDDPQSLYIEARDGSRDSPGTQSSGVRSIEVKVDGNRADYSRQACPQSSCQATSEFALYPERYGLGWHTVEVRVQDQVGLSAVQSFRIQVVSASGLSDSARVAGIEEWFQYQSLSTGADTEAKVNLANGNLLWRATPVENPGRGLSTVASLTYNSQSRPSTATPYVYAGQGFSLGIAGITRLNEPLDLSRLQYGQIKLVDSDGTLKRFSTRDLQNQAFSSPPGTHLNLRRFSDVWPQKYWAATGPGGTTYFFDRYGFETLIQDRNGNVIRFDYQLFHAKYGTKYGKLRARCARYDGVTCFKRVIRITDSAGVIDGAANRSVDVSYYPGGLPQAVNPDQTTRTSSQAGRVSQIRDHAGRITSFEYTPLGQLGRLTEAKGTPEERSFTFSYESQGTVPALTGITDPRGAQTRISYRPSDSDPATRRVEEIRDRSDNPTRIAYGGALRPETTATDARNKSTTYTFDERGRADSIVDPAGTVTEQEWDADNNLSTTIEAAGTATEVRNETSFNANGSPVTSIDPKGNRTDVTYRDSAGPLELQSELGLDAGGVFISDVTSTTDPQGTATDIPDDYMTAYTVDPRGNVTQVRDPAGNTTHKAYDSFGRVTSEADEMGKVTSYSCFDANGLAQLEVDKNGNSTPDDPNDGRWIRHYDNVGKLLDETDPRGTQTGDCSTERSEFTNSYAYDALGRKTSERTPKDSANGEFSEKRYTYDPNGNIVATVDANGNRSETEYTATDLVREERSPPTAHEGEGRSVDPEVTRYEYDAVGNLTEETAPEGTATSTGNDYSTRYVYNDMGDVVAEVERQRGDGQRDGEQDKDLVTSYAYDRLGNMVGTVDPKENAQGGDPVANAQDPSKRALTVQYDKNGNVTAEVEDPGGENNQTEYRYDKNDQLTAEVDPLGLEGGARDGEGSSPEDFTTRYEYDERGELTAEVEPGNTKTEYELRPDGLVSAVTEPRGANTDTDDDFKATYTYDAKGEVARETLPRAQGQYGPPATVEYQRDPVGNPTSITDANGNTSHNTFLDSGELKTTDKPSLWALDSGTPSQDNADQEDDQPTSAGQPTAEGQPTDDNQAGAGDFGAIEPQELPELMPDAGRTTLSYDDEGNVRSVTDADGKTATVDYDAAGRVTKVEVPQDTEAANPEDHYISTSFTYDKNSNLRKTIDDEGNAATVAYDQFERPTQETAPGANEGAEVTKTKYDDNGNVTGVETPRGDQFDHEFTYDRLNQLKTETNPEGEKTSYDYDASGNLTLIRSPKAEEAPEGTCEPNPPYTRKGCFETRVTYDPLGQPTKVKDGLGYETKVDYDKNGNPTRTVEPGAALNSSGQTVPIVTESIYDGRDLPWKDTTIGGAGPRTEITEFDPNGNLRRQINPEGVDEQTRTPKTADPNPTAPVPVDSEVDKDATVYEYTADGLAKSVHLPWGEDDQDDRRRVREDFRYNEVGDLTSIDAPYEWRDGETPCQDIVDPAPGRCQNRTTYTNYDSGWIKTQRDPALEDPQTHQRIYERTTSYAYDGRGNETEWRSTSDDPQNTRRVERLAYFPNGALRQKQASRTGDDTPRTYTYGYNKNGSLTELTDQNRDQTTQVSYDGEERQTLVNETWSAGKDTAFQYDKDGNVTQTKVDGSLDNGAYVGGKTTASSFDPLGRELETVICPTCQGDERRVTANTYLPSGALKLQVRPNGVQERYAYEPNGSLAAEVRQPPGASQETQTYAYDRNGEIKRDERGTYSYNARDQLTQWNRSQGPLAGTTVSYKLSPSGAVTEKNDNGELTQNAYLGDRLLSSTTQGQRTSYSYDDLGSLTSIDPPQGNPTRFTYDEFERLTSSQGPGQQTPTTFRYDALDRVEQKLQGEQTYDLSYVGLSETLSREQVPSGAMTYDYNAKLQPLGQTQGTNYRSYEVDPVNGSIKALESQTGQITPASRYLYDPYGEIENTSTLGPEARQNPMRFGGFYFDEQTGTYDMQARVYKPSLSRFLSQDRLKSPTADLALQSDPQTQNRYVYAAGDPVNLVEEGGHRARRHGRGGGGGRGHRSRPRPPAARSPSPRSPHRPARRNPAQRHASRSRRSRPGPRAPRAHGSRRRARHRPRSARRTTRRPRRSSGSRRRRSAPQATIAQYEDPRRLCRKPTRLGGATSPKYKLWVYRPGGGLALVRISLTVEVEECRNKKTRVVYYPYWNTESIANGNVNVFYSLASRRSDGKWKGVKVRGKTMFELPDGSAGPRSGSEPFRQRRFTPGRLYVTHAELAYGAFACGTGCIPASLGYKKPIKIIY